MYAPLTHCDVTHNRLSHMGSYQGNSHYVCGGLLFIDQLNNHFEGSMAGVFLYL